MRELKHIWVGQVTYLKLHSSSKIGLKLQQMPFDCTLCSGDSSMRYSGSFLLSLVLFKIIWHSPGEQLEGIWEWCAVSWGIQGNIFIFRIKVENMCQKAPSEVVLLFCVLTLWMKLRTYRWGQGDSMLQNEQKQICKKSLTLYNINDLPEADNRQNH